MSDYALVSEPGASHLLDERFFTIVPFFIDVHVTLFLIIYLSVVLFLLVLYPLVGIPQGVTGCLPPDVFPSPPPIGWSTGFITTPRTLGLRPIHLVLPALPTLIFSCSTLPTWPKVALHSTRTFLTSPEGSLIWAYPPSLAISWPYEPALRIIWPPLPIFNSTLWTNDPRGIFFRGHRVARFHVGRSPLQSCLQCNSYRRQLYISSRHRHSSVRQSSPSDSDRIR